MFHQSIDAGRAKNAWPIMLVLLAGCAGNQAAGAAKPVPEAGAAGAEQPGAAVGTEGAIRPGAAALPQAAEAVVNAPVMRQAPVEELIRVRCATDGQDVYVAWTGTVYAFVPGERQRALFRTVGMNVTRCLQSEGAWTLTSRELMYYLDPTSGEVLDRWQNPWTSETVPVMHVANSPVQNTFSGTVPAQSSGDMVTMVLDVPLFYPNRLDSDKRFADFSAGPHYEAGEFFSLLAPAHEAQDSKRATVSKMHLTWNRVGPWLPWMKMGKRPGYLVYSAHGTKVSGYEGLPELIRRDIDTRLPLYRSAPACVLEQRNESSWSYFARHFDAYKAGERFPIAAPAANEPCKP